MRAFPLIRDLVTDVSWNYEVNKTIQPFTPPTDVPQEDWRWQQQDIERVQEYRKCIECFLCQDVCHVLRNHETEKPFMGPRYLVRAAGLEMHPIDQADRRGYLKDGGGIGYCNITKCCTEVCPEHIKITDNAIIPLKERVADEYYDPIQWVLAQAPRRRVGRAGTRVELPVLQGAAVGHRRATPERGPVERRRSVPDARRPSAAERPPPARPRPRGPRGFVIRTDGAARGNPGPASLGRGAVSTSPGPTRATPRAVPDASISDYLGVQTNNVAEYTGVVRALELARELGAREVHLLLDSKLIVEQLAGRWRVKDAKLHPALDGGAPDAGGFDRWSAAHVPRAQNSRRRRAGQRGDRPGRRRRPGVGRASPAGLSRPGARPGVE